MKISLKAQTKLLLHAAKYPNNCVLGLLIGKSEIATDCVPLQHYNLPLASTLDAAFAILLPFLAKSGSEIVAIYFANESTEDKETPLVVAKLTEKTGAVAVRIDFNDDGVVLSMLGIGKGLVLSLIDTREVEQDPSFSLKEFKEKYTATAKGVALDKLHDFDSHLDDVSKEWLVTKELDSMLSM
jgi:hypothetical protein